MKRGWKIAIGVAACVILLLVILSFTGFEPTQRIPGLWLRKGDLVTTPVTNWGFSEKYDTIMVQTRSRYLLPESVSVRCDVDSKGNLYISSRFFAGMQFPGDKSWATNAIRDPHVRIKIGNQLFDRDLHLIPLSDRATMAELHDAKVKKYHWKPEPGEIIHWFEVMPPVSTAQATTARPN